METKDLTFKITFYSDWHCGSGLSAGADIDSLVIKDERKLPYIPGKTIKGLFKDSATRFLQHATIGKNATKIFGEEGSKHSELFFSDAELSKEDQYNIFENQLTKYLYRSIDSTAVNDEGITKRESLRKIEVTIPCELYCKILSVPKNLESEFLVCAKLIKKLGSGRNRGFGRCDIDLINNYQINQL